mmetsp:Transcript_11300/g.36069  ORF Transcript_11300/g.36069 Transcript_11300/m.36069 type:complete len:255 (+) Transcript_11300:1717-2481(+)
MQHLLAGPNGYRFDALEHSDGLDVIAAREQQVAFTVNYQEALGLQRGAVALEGLETARHVHDPAKTRRRAHALDYGRLHTLPGGVDNADFSVVEGPAHSNRLRTSRRVCCLCLQRTGQCLERLVEARAVVRVLVTAQQRLGEVQEVQTNGADPAIKLDNARARFDPAADLRQDLAKCGSVRLPKHEWGKVELGQVREGLSSDHAFSDCLRPKDLVPGIMLERVNVVLVAAGWVAVEPQAVEEAVALPRGLQVAL